MVTDCHYHYFAEEFDYDRKLSEMESCGIEKIALMAPIAAIFESEPEKPIMRFMRSLFGKKLFMPLFRKLLCTFKGSGIDIMGEEVPIYFTPDNTGVFEIADKHTDRLMAWVTLNPSNCSSEKVTAELKKWSQHEAFIGVKAHPFYHQYKASCLEPIFTALNEMEKPILIHMGFDDMPHILRLADKYLNVNVILAHCAFPFFDIMWPEIAKRKNIFVDISSSCYVDEKTVRRAVCVLGVEKLVYGSDGPYGPSNHSGSFDLKYQIGNAMSWLNTESQSSIGYTNFQKLINN